MQELFGDSSRGGDWAAVRLLVDGDRIAEADAPGLERDVAGLTLLEAATVGGETLAVDALANALGPVFHAAPSQGRAAVAMSGGVDSAVALLRSLSNAVGVTLRLWLDPEGPDSERACCSPESVIAARETCHRLGVPHVTLDLREEFRRAVVTPFVRGYARGLTPNPCTRCNGGFRFAELLAFARRAGCERLVTGHYARVLPHRGVPLLARGVDASKDQSYMLAAVDPRHLMRVAFPLGEQDVLPRRRRLPLLPRPARARAAGGRDRGRGGQRARPPRRLLALHGRPAARSRPCRARAALRPRLQPVHEHRGCRPA
jgi:tRNA-specific 2-thiouridylase